MRSRSIRPCDEFVQFIKICLCEITSAHSIFILHGNRDYAALLVLRDLGASRKMLGRINAIALVVNMLQVEPVNEMTTDGFALQQVNEQGGRGVSAKESTRET